MKGLTHIPSLNNKLSAVSLTADEQQMQQTIADYNTQLLQYVKPVLRKQMIHNSKHI